MSHVSLLGKNTVPMTYSLRSHLSIYSCFKDMSMLAVIPIECLIDSCKNIADFVTSLLWDLDSNLWLGLSDRFKAGQYRWQDNSEVTYTNWASGQPFHSSMFNQHQVNLNLISLLLTKIFFSLNYSKLF